jgi:hypothetical protein
MGYVLPQHLNLDGSAQDRSRRSRKAFDRQASPRAQHLCDTLPRSGPPGLPGLSALAHSPLGAPPHYLTPASVPADRTEPSRTTNLSERHTVLGRASAVVGTLGAGHRTKCSTNPPRAETYELTSEYLRQSAAQSGPANRKSRPSCRTGGCKRVASAGRLARDSRRRGGPTLLWRNSVQGGSMFWRATECVSPSKPCRTG